MSQNRGRGREVPVGHWKVQVAQPATVVKINSREFDPNDNMKLSENVTSLSLVNGTNPY